MDPRVTEFRNKAIAVAAELGAGWSVATPPEEANYWHAELTGPNGAALSFNADHKGKGCVRGIYPRSPTGGFRCARDWGVIGYHDKAPECGFTFSRPAAVIAVECIRRKVLPRYLELLKKCQELYVAEAKRNTATVVATNRLANVVGAAWHTDSNLKEVHTRFYLPGDLSGTVEVHSTDSVDVELRGLTAEVAERVLKALKG